MVGNQQYHHGAFAVTQIYEESSKKEVLTVRQNIAYIVAEILTKILKSLAFYFLNAVFCVKWSNFWNNAHKMLNFSPQIYF